MSIDISVIWFVIIVFATLMYIVMDGFDLGLGCCSAWCMMAKSAM
ncbi:Cytochrome bd2, subunit II [Klebsiella pneumoniae]|uniref:Cytochrome bd2, subunit II n=1 Tax=Klebsiella pneumoniae TaxID=573 RepID=A0A378F6B9_KLEPN|nr:Cytochrome bd2, subunit II [Klebsiella pneumoniae]